MKKAISICLILTFLLAAVSGFTLSASGAPDSFIDELDDWSKVLDKSSGWQIDPYNAELGNVINKAGNNDGQYIVYQFDGIQNIEITGYQWNVMADCAGDIKAYVSDDNAAWEEVMLTAAVPEPVGVSHWSKVVLSAENIPGAVSYLRVEMQALNIDNVANCWVTSIGSVGINTLAIPEPPDNITDELGDWSKVHQKSSGWQIDASDPALGSVINKAGNNDVQFVVYKLSKVESITVYATQFTSMSNASEDIAVYISEDGSAWTPVPMRTERPEEAGSWKIIPLTAAFLQNASMVKIELKALNIDNMANCFVTGIAKVEINQPLPEGLSFIDDELDGWGYVYQKSAGWQIDNTDPELGSVINKAGNNDVQHIIYWLSEVKNITVYAAQFSSMSDAVNDITAWVSANGTDWTKVPLTADKGTAAGNWQIIPLRAENIQNACMLKIELNALNIDDVANCFVTGITRVSINGPGAIIPEAPSTIDDELNSWDKIFEKSGGWQIDATVPQLGSVINKMGNNDTQYITYKAKNIQSAVVYACQFAFMSDVTKDIRIHVSQDNITWTEASFLQGRPTLVESWKIVPLLVENLGGAQYLRVTMGQLDIDNMSNCWVTALTRVKINLPDDELNITHIHDDLDDWTNVFEKSDGWQIDKSNAALGSVINKMGNNDPQHITYMMNKIGSFSASVCSYSSFSEVSKDFKVYISNDNKTWKQVPYQSAVGEVKGAWTLYTISARNFPESTKYLKLELQPLGIDNLTNCWVTGIASVDVFASKNPSTGDNAPLMALFLVMMAALPVLWLTRRKKAR